MVKKRTFGAKTGVGHWIGHMYDKSGVGRGVCIKHCDFGETNRNAKYLSAVYKGGDRRMSDKGIILLKFVAVGLVVEPRTFCCVSLKSLICWCLS